MRQSDPLLTGLSCAMLLGCYASQTLHTAAFVLALIALLWRIEQNSGEGLQRLRGVDWAIALYVVAFVVSAAMGVNTEESFHVITELKRPALAYIVASSLNTRRDAWMVAGTALF